MSNHIPPRNFVDSNPSLHKTLPAGPSPRSSPSLLRRSPRISCGRKGEVWYLPSLTRLVSWWQFNVLARIQRVDKRFNGRSFATMHDTWPHKNTTVATGFTVQAPASQNWTSLRKQKDTKSMNGDKWCTRRLCISLASNPTKTATPARHSQTLHKIIVFLILHLGQTGDSHAFQRAP